MKKYFVKFLLILTLIPTVILSGTAISADTKVYEPQTAQGISSLPGTVLRDKGSCMELVKVGKLSPRNCGYSQGRPTGANIWLTPKQWNCVVNAYSMPFVVASVPATLGGGAIIGVNAWRTMLSCNKL